MLNFTHEVELSFYIVMLKYNYEYTMFSAFLIKERRIKRGRWCLLSTSNYQSGFHCSVIDRCSPINPLGQRP